MARPKADGTGSGEPGATGESGGGGSFDALDAALGAIDPGSLAGPVDGGASGDDSTFDPERHLGPDKLNADGSYRRKRAKRGTGGTARVGRKTSGSRSPSVNAIENALVGIHSMLALATKTPELALEDDESKPLAQAVAEVAKHYDIPAISDVAIAWAGLIMVCGKTYGPRYVLVTQRLKEERAEKKATAGQVIDFPFAPHHTPDHAG